MSKLLIILSFTMLVSSYSAFAGGSNIVTQASALPTVILTYGPTVLSQSTDNVDSLAAAENKVCKTLLEGEFKKSAFANAGYNIVTKTCKIVESKTHSEPNYFKNGTFRVHAQMVVILDK